MAFPPHGVGNSSGCPDSLISPSTLHILLRAASTDMLCAPTPSTWNQNFPSYTPILTACLVSVSMPSERRRSLKRLVCSMHSP